MMCRVMMRQFETPLAWAASMYSLRLMLSVWPRTMRAMSSQFTAPMAIYM